MGPKTHLGVCGELHPEILRAFDITGPVVGFEIVLDALPAPRNRVGRARPKLVISDLMPVERDFAFLVDRTVGAGELVAAVRSADRALIADVGVFDVYEGAGVPDLMKSVAVAVTLQPKEKTMTEPELDAISATIVSAVAQRTGGVLRS